MPSVDQAKHAFLPTGSYVVPFWVGDGFCWWGNSNILNREKLHWRLWVERPVSANCCTSCWDLVLIRGSRIQSILIGNSHGWTRFHVNPGLHGLIIFDILRRAVGGSRACMSVTCKTTGSIYPPETKSTCLILRGRSVIVLSNAHHPGPETSRIHRLA